MADAPFARLIIVATPQTGVVGNAASARGAGGLAGAAVPFLRASICC